ncbi:MAG TPA: cytochrome c peroxidase, partial [Sulfurovum sp.]
MKLSKIIAASIVASSVLFAGSLADKAKSMGLQAIPADKNELLKLTDPNGTITAQKVELGKKLYFEPRLSKSGIISCN